MTDQEDMKASMDAERQAVEAAMEEHKKALEAHSQELRNLGDVNRQVRMILLLEDCVSLLAALNRNLLTLAKHMEEALPKSNIVVPRPFTNH